MTNHLSVLVSKAAIVALTMLLVNSFAFAGGQPPQTSENVSCGACFTSPISSKSKNNHRYVLQCDSEVTFNLINNKTSAVVELANGGGSYVVGAVCSRTMYNWLWEDFGYAACARPDGNGAVVCDRNGTLIAKYNANNCPTNLVKQHKLQLKKGDSIRIIVSHNMKANFTACPVGGGNGGGGDPQEPKLKAQFECIDRRYGTNGNVTHYTAHFTPVNTSGQQQTIAVGTSGANTNQFFLNGQAYHPAEAHATATPYFTFHNGRVEGQLSVTVPADKEIVWKLGINGQVTSASANAWAPECQPTIPLVCVDFDYGVLRWGYKSLKHFAALYPAQAALGVNIFNPAPLYRGQPVRLAKGEFKTLFTTEKLEGLTWYLANRFVTAHPDTTPVCNSGHVHGHSLKKTTAKTKKRHNRLVKKMMKPKLN